MKILLLPILGLFLSACGGEKSSLKFSAPNNQELTGETDFATLRNGIFRPYCVRCHAQYDSYSGVKADIMKIQDAVESNRMPKNVDPLTASKKEFLSKWISAGAPEGSVTDTEDPQIISWNRVSREILGPKCIQCHNPDGQAKFLDLSSRQALWKKRKELLDFDAPQNSYLLSVINDPEEPMPPVWSGLQRLTEEDTNLLGEWIKQGIP